MRKETYVVTTNDNQVRLIAGSVKEAKEYYKKLHGDYEWIEAVNYTELLS
jgi:hypothetical protein